MHDGWMWAMGWGWVPILALLGAGLWLAARATLRGPAPPTPPSRNDAEETLRDRYARGEIGKDEYRARLETLHRA
jgi:uncharacterized membrane protein